MTIHFYLKFHTRYGQALFVTGNIDALGNDQIGAAFPLTYFNNQFWHGSIDIINKNENVSISYTYIFRDEDGTEIIEGETSRIINLSEASAKEVILTDTWNHAGTIENAFYTKPFKEMIFEAEPSSKKLKHSKHCTHEFRVKCPLMRKHEMLFITGSGKALQE